MRNSGGAMRTSEIGLYIVAVLPALALVVAWLVGGGNVLSQFGNFMKDPTVLAVTIASVSAIFGIALGGHMFLAREWIRSANETATKLAEAQREAQRRLDELYRSTSVG
jgi:hypothetical protein